MFFSYVFWWNILFRDCFQKHDIWDFSPRAGINCFWICLFFILQWSLYICWFILKNFCNFGCIFTSLPVSLVKLVSKGSVFPNLALSFVVWRKKEKIRRMPFITIKLVNKINEDHSLVFTNLHASYRNFKNKSKYVLNAHKNQNYSIQ